MVTYINYTVANVSGFAQSYDYASQVMYTGTGGMSHDIFGLLVLFGIFMVFTGISMKFNQERAFLYGLFITCIATSIMVSGQLLNPIWAAVPFSLFLISLFVWGSKS
jgi:predicted MFS family arabinose efflux permease